MDINRRTVLKAALLPLALGAYEGAQVFKRRHFPTFTPEAFGAVGDGISDDGPALSRACQALQASGRGQLLLSGTYRVGRGNAGQHRVGALELIGGDRYEVIFVRGAEILMDNLNPATGNGDELGGLYFAGPINELILRQPRVRWKTRPSSRSQGDGIMLRGYPGDTRPTIKRCLIDHPQVEAAPQAHIILLGVSDPQLISPRAAYGHGDGCHFNACRRPVVTGGLWVEETGDDALALVTYYGPAGQPLYKEDTDRAPFSMQALSEWSNGHAQIDRVECVGGQANACRLNGAYQARIGTVYGQRVQQGLQVDATRANGSTLAWTVAASRGCVVEQVTTQQANYAVLAQAQNIDPSAQDASDFLNMDVVIEKVSARQTSGGVSVLVAGVNGIQIKQQDVDGAVHLQG